MKIKILGAALLMGLVMAAGVHAFGFGAQLNFYTGKVFAPGAALAISPSEKVHIAINWYLGAADRANRIGLTLDLSPLSLPIVPFSNGSLNFTLGAGIYSTVLLADDPGVNGGLRLPVGLSLWVGRRALEIYGHVAPSFGVDFLPALGLGDPFFPIALGVRLWI